jgi:hypothetical protein
MSKKKKFLSGVGVLILAGGVSAVASVPSNAAQSKSGTARVAQAAPDIGGSQRIIVSVINAGALDYFRAVPTTGVLNSSLNNGIVSQKKLAPKVKVKLNKVGQKGLRGPTGLAGPKGDHDSADPAGSDDHKGDTEATDPAGSDDHKGDTEATDPAGSDDHKGDTEATDPAGSDDHKGDIEATDPAGSDD